MGKHRWPINGDPWDPPLEAPAAFERRGSTDGWTGRVRPGRRPETRLDARHDEVPAGSVPDQSTADIGVGRNAEGPSPGGIVDGWDEAPGPAVTPVLEEARDAERPPALPRIQWRVARSAALVFLGVALAVGAALFLVRSSEPSAAAVSVQLESGDGKGATGDTKDRASDSGTPHGPPDEEAGPGGTVTGAEVGGSPVGTPSASPVLAGKGGGDWQTIVVYVTGAVTAPGVVTVPAGTRLFEVLEDAGGPLPEADLEGVNLAAAASDGQHVHLLAVGEEPRPGVVAPDAPAPPQGGSGTGHGSTAAPAGTGAPAGLLDINTATLADIETLPRVGPVLGQRIIDWRDEHGPFIEASDLDAVPGIGPAMLEGILPLISVR
ncbi:helix-hairpin-helix domain-containing protein [Arthrobacter sp. MDT2-16]